MPKPTHGTNPHRVDGVVTGLRERAEPVGRGVHTRIDHIITFVLVAANERPEVEMRADAFVGEIHDGDRISVGVHPKRRTGAPIQSALITNHTRGGTFGARPPSNRSYLTRWAFALAIGFCVTIVLVAKVGPSFV